MSLQKDSGRRFFNLAFAVVLCFSLKPTLSAQGPASSPAQPVSTVQQKLAEEKLRQETIKLQLENRKLASLWERILSYAAAVTVLLAVGGFGFTFWKQITENSRLRTLDSQQRERELRERTDSASAKLEEQFDSTVTNLGSESASIQASAAIQMMKFLKLEHKTFHKQAFLILGANLKIQYNTNIQNKVLANLLVAAFQEAIRTELQPGPIQERSPLDLSRSYLKRADLSDLDLRGADLAFAELEGANLTGSTLFRMRGYEVNLEKARLSRANLGEGRLRKAFLSGAQLHGANLVAADLRETDLTRAQFQQAKLQSTHFEKSNLTGARFEQADLNDAYFQGATLPQATLKSIIKAVNWEKAHYDESVRATLQTLPKE